MSIANFKYLIYILIAILTLASCGTDSINDEPNSPTQANPDWEVVGWESLYDYHGIYENKSAGCRAWKEAHKNDLVSDEVVDGKRVCEWRFVVKDKTKVEMEQIAGEFMGFTIVGGPDGNGQSYMDHFYMQYTEINK